MFKNITYRQLNSVVFPVFSLQGELEYRDGLVIKDDKVVDDRNQPFETLALRRLHTPHKKLRLTTAAQDLSSLLKINSTTFIDSRGNLLKYNKTRYFPLKYKRIKNIEYKDSFSVVSVFGEQAKFRVPRPPPAGFNWLGIIYLYYRPTYPFEYSEEKKPDTRKKI